MLTLAKFFFKEKLIDLLRTTLAPTLFHIVREVESICVLVNIGNAFFTVELAFTQGVGTSLTCCVIHEQV
jgi:hypothetical protein